MASKIRYVVASDVSDRDGIEIEIYLDEEMIVEIFRDDKKRVREVNLWRKDIPLELIEEAISIFKREIPWDFIVYKEDL